MVTETVDCGDVQRLVCEIHQNRNDLEEGDLLHRLDRFNSYEKRSVSLGLLDLGEFDLDTDKVQDYFEQYQKTGSYPPIVVDMVDGSIIDGIHRANALLACGLEEVHAYVGTEANVDPYWRQDQPDDDDNEGNTLADEVECDLEHGRDDSAPRM
jgi:hypothetical protein